MHSEGGLQNRDCYLIERGKEKVIYIRYKYDQQDKIHIILD